MGYMCSKCFKDAAGATRASIESAPTKGGLTVEAVASSAGVPQPEPVPAPEAASVSTPPSGEAPTGGEAAMAVDAVTEGGASAPTDMEVTPQKKRNR
jgi:hypothetical protein